jgi:hypothetical protein
MRVTEIYEGHTIEARTHAVDKGRWSWDYTIDGEHRGEGCARPMRSEELTLKDALYEAKARIRHWLRTGEVPLAAEQLAGQSESHCASLQRPAEQADRITRRTATLGLPKIRGYGASFSEAV